MPPPDPLAGTRYKLLGRLGVGGSADVFLVEHLDLKRKFVAKVLHARHVDDPEYVARMRREARALGRLSHPNIVSATDFAITSSGRPLIVMEYLNGNTLAEELGERRRLPLAEALGYARQALSALAAAHELGIVHRDLKPQNLLLHRIEGYEPVLKVLDFGAARNLSADPAHATGLVTRTGTVIGSFQYLSPEGRAGRRVDLRADLYALALVCCAMLSGQPPSSELAGGAQLSARNLGLAAYVPDARLRAALEACLLRALASEPDARFASAPAFAEALPVLES